MLTIKLSRTGKKKHPLYRLVVLEKARDPWGRHLENLGTYDPHAKKAELKAERIRYWIGQGAKMTATVNNLLISQNVLSGEKVRASKSKLGKKKRAALTLKEKTAAPQEPAVKEETKTEETLKE